MSLNNNVYLTAPEMLAEALEQLKLLQNSLTLFNNLQGKEKLLAQEKNIKIFTLIVENLKYAMLLGQGDACFHLAHFHYKGWGFSQNKEIGNFIILIGKELSSDQCLKAKLENTSTELDKKIFQCSKVILNNKNNYYNRKITDEIKSDVMTSFNKILPSDYEIFGGRFNNQTEISKQSNSLDDFDMIEAESNKVDVTGEIKQYEVDESCIDCVIA